MARDDDPELERYERPEMPFERKADPGLRGAGMAAAGIEFAAIVGLFFLAGQWLDGRVEGEQPWFTIGLSMLGVAAATYLLIRQAQRASGGPDKKE